jgi:hypothetical protein
LMNLCASDQPVKVVRSEIRNIDKTRAQTWVLFDLR